MVGSEFRSFRIQTVRDNLEEDECCPFTIDDEPFDPEFGAPYFALYGVLKDEFLEHIADRKTYSAALHLAKQLAPGIAFPDQIVVRFGGQ